MFYLLKASGSGLNNMSWFLVSPEGLFLSPFQMKYYFLIYSTLFCYILSILTLYIVIVFFAFSLMGYPGRVSRSAIEQKFLGPESVCHNKKIKYIWNYLINNLGEEQKLLVWSQKQMAANSGSLMVLWECLVDLNNSCLAAVALQLEAVLVWNLRWVIASSFS